MNKYMRSFVPYHSPLDPCPPIGKNIILLLLIYFRLSTAKLTAIHAKRSTPKGTLWPVFMTIMKILIKRAVTTDVNQSLPEEYYQLLLELQELDFVLVELTLYLDTHPDDTAAINQFNDFSYKRRVLKQRWKKNTDHSNSLETVIRMPLGNGAKVLGHGKYKGEKLCGFMKRNYNTPLKWELAIQHLQNY